MDIHATIDSKKKSKLPYVLVYTNGDNSMKNNCVTIWVNQCDNLDTNMKSDFTMTIGQCINHVRSKM